MKINKGHGPSRNTVIAKQDMRMVQAMSYSGPIPPAQELRNYENVLPGAADRILSMAEKQATHRRNLESKMLDAKIKTEKRGQLFGFIVFIVAIIVGIIYIALGQNLVGVSILIGNTVTLAGVFVYGRHSEKKELAEKNKKLS